MDLAQKKKKETRTKSKPPGKEKSLPPVKKTAQREITRYSVRAEMKGKVEEVAIGTDLAAEIVHAKAHYARYGVKTWVWNVRTGETVHRCERSARAGGGR